jgi:outer membrane protein assembly factor BamB
VWEIKFDGEIISTPIVDENILFVQTTQSLSAVDLLTREVLWKVNVSGAYSNAPFLLKDGILIISDKEFEISAIDASSGDVLWHNELNSGSNQRTLDIILQNGQIYIAKYFGRIYSLDADTGQINWLAHSVDKSPLWLYGNNNENEIIVIGRNKIYEFSALNGLTFGEVTFEGTPNSVFLDWDQKYIFGDKGKDSFDPVRVFNDKENSVDLIGYLPITGANCAVANGKDLLIVGDGIVRYDPQNQSIKWVQKIGKNLTCPIIIDGRIYSRKSADDLYIFLLDTGELVGGMDLYSELYFVHYFSVDPFIVNDLVILQTQKDVLSAIRFID